MTPREMQEYVQTTLGTELRKHVNETDPPNEETLRRHLGEVLDNYFRGLKERNVMLFPFPTGILAGAARARGEEVPAEIPDLAQLWANGVEVGEVEAKPDGQMIAHLKYIGAEWRWAATEAG